MIGPDRLAFSLQLGEPSLQIFVFGKFGHHTNRRILIGRWREASANGPLCRNCRFGRMLVAGVRVIFVMELLCVAAGALVNGCRF